MRERRERKRRSDNKIIEEFRKNSEGKQKLSLKDAILQAAVMEHFQNFVAKESRNMVLSVPVSGAASLNLHSSLSAGNATQDAYNNNLKNSNNNNNDIATTCTAAKN